MSTYLFIDGTNLYASQYELFGPSEYLYFPSFLKQIESKLHIIFDQIYFYASYSPRPEHPTNKEKLYLKNESFFYRSVKSMQKLTFFKGYRSPTSGKEKEVDVKLAVDIVEKAAKNLFKTAYLISGDADFMEALFSARRFKKDIKVICLENKIMFKALYFFPFILIKILDKKILFMTEKKYKLIKLRKKDLTETI